MNYREFCNRWEDEGIRDWPLMTVIEKHTGAEGAEAAWWASRLHTHGIMNGYRVYSRAKDIEALSELDQAIAKVQRLLHDEGPLTSLAYERLLMELRCGKVGGIKSDPDEGQDALAHLEGDDGMDVTLLLDLEERGDAIRAAIGRTIAEIETSALAKVAASKINERGIALVDASRFIWQLATETQAPSKDLNPASSFGDFLADVFEVCGVPGDPRSAFRAWARERGDWSLDQAK